MLVMRLKPKPNHFVIRMPEWGLSLTLGAYSLQLLIHDQPQDFSPAYRVLGRFVDEQAWGGVGMIVSVSWLTGLIINGLVPHTRRWTPLIRSASAFGASAWWGLSAVIFLFIAPWHQGLIANTSFAFLALANSIITASEVGAEEWKAKNGCPSA